MIRLLFVLFFCFSASVLASPVRDQEKIVNLNFDKISVIELANFVYGDILKQNFALHPALVGNDKLVTVHFQSDFDKAKLSVFMENLLSGVGVAIQKKPGYLFLSPIAEKDQAEPDQEIFYYRAKYRPVSYIMDLTASLFKTGKFTGQRSGIRSSLLDFQPVLVSAAPQGVTKKPVQDTGTSAYSLQDKNEQDAFIFHGTEKEIAQLQKLLQQIDVQTGEVLVKGMVYEVTTGEKDGSAFGLALNSTLTHLTC
jgi:hypothetical protein